VHKYCIALLLRCIVVYEKNHEINRNRNILLIISDLAVCMYLLLHISIEWYLHYIRISTWTDVNGKHEKHDMVTSLQTHV